MTLSLLPGTFAAAADTASYNSYRDIPGVTEDEIELIEQVKASRESLIYGSLPTTDAFLEMDGSVGGFSALVCELFTGLFGIRFEPVLVEWEDYFDRLESGAIDFCSDLTPTAERREQFNMTDPIGERPIRSFRNRNHEKLSQIALERTLRYGFLDGSVNYQLVQKNSDLPFEARFAKSFAHAAEMLESGEIDAFVEEAVTEAFFEDFAFIAVEDYYPLLYSPVAVSTPGDELLPFISVMQKYLENGGQIKLAQLYYDGYESYQKHKLFLWFTEEEKEYIRAHSDAADPVRTLMEYDNYPKSFYNTREREIQGIVPDILDEISRMTGLVFAQANTDKDSWADLLGMLERGDADIVSELIYSSERGEHYLWPDTPYLSDNYALLSKAETADININQILYSRVGVVSGSAYEEVFVKWFPDHDGMVRFNTTMEAFDALENGSVDFVMSSQNQLLCLTNYLEKPGFKANIVFEKTYDSGFGVSRDEAVLCSIIDKTLAFMDVGTISGRWTRKVFDYQAKIMQTVLPVVAGIGAVAVLALVFALFQLMRNKRMSRGLERLVTERTAELALQTSTLTTIFDSIPDIVFCKAPDLSFTRCNKSFERFFDCREQDIIGLNEEQAFKLPPETTRFMREAELEVIRGKKLIQAEEAVPSANGTVRMFETVRVPLIHDGEPVGLMGIARDITQRKAAEETLKLTLDNIDSCVVITEVGTGEILFINDKMIGEYGGGVGGTCWTEFAGQSDRCPNCPVLRLLEEPESAIVSDEQNDATGKYFKHTDSLITWHDDRLVHMRHSVDITDLIKLQQELESASRAKGDFLSRMSHEIRTPMNAILGMAMIADGTDDISRIRYCLSTIKTSSDHLLGLINDILDMSKIEAGKLELECAPFNLEKTLMKISNIIIDKTEAKRQRLNVIFEPRMHLHYLGDELRLSQVITNLLSNAVKFTPEEGSITVKLDTAGRGGDLRVLRVSVRDTGIGMTREQISRLFTSFSQADDSITRRFGGTGLGLAISKSIVEKMNGRIWVESEPGNGSAFIFEVELTKAEKQGAARLYDGIVPSDMRLLIIDASADVRSQFAGVVQSLGMSTDEAGSGEAGLDAAARIAASGGGYDVIFLDCRLPDIEGAEMLRRLSELIDKNTAVVMTTFAEWTEIEKTVRAYGLSRYILKPLFPSSVLDTINEVVGKIGKDTDIGAVADVPSADFSGVRILLAEDVEINQMIFITLMEDTGALIDTADNGREAVRMFEAEPDKYDMILMDVQMPEMSGIEATQTIRASGAPRAGTIPIIAMTANAFKEDIDRCIAAGMNDHLAKPIDIDEVFKKISLYRPAADSVR